MHYPSSLFNRMVFPFVGYGLRSILWYRRSADHALSLLYLIHLSLESENKFLNNLQKRLRFTLRIL